MADKLIITKDGVFEESFTPEELVKKEADRVNSLPTLEQAKEQKILELNTDCNQLILNGFPSTCTGVEHQYKFDMEYQANFSQQGVMVALDPTMTSVLWPTSDAGVLSHTREQFIQLCNDAQTWKSTNTYRYFELKAQVMSLDSIDAINLVAW